MIPRRKALLTTAALAGAGSWRGTAGAGHPGDYEDPYAEVDWDHWGTLDSMSHQHQGQNEASLDLFRKMGYGHFAFSNYYPSAPTYPLPDPAGPEFRDHRRTERGNSIPFSTRACMRIRSAVSSPPDSGPACPERNGRSRPCCIASRD